MTAELGRTAVDYELLEAVDGLAFNIDDVVDPSASQLPGTEPRWARNWSAPGVVACAVSHLRAAERILEGGHTAALVLEDDVLLPPDLGPLLDSIADHLVGAEVVLLNFDSRDTTRLSRAGAIELGSSRHLMDPVEPSEIHSAAAYVITREACERMVAALIPVRAFSDDWDFFLGLGALDRFRCVYPMPVQKDPSFASTIEYRRKLNSRLHSLAVNHRIPVMSELIVYRRRKILRRWNQVEVVDSWKTADSASLDPEDRCTTA